MSDLCASPRPSRRLHRAAGLLATAGLAVTLAACGGGSTAGSAVTTPPAAASAASSAEQVSSSLADSPACTALRAEHPDLVGTTQTNALNPHTPGYEVIDQEDPTKFQGFDIDLGNAIASCLGFTVDYVAVGFSELIPTVASGQADWIVSNLYATKERAAGGVDFISYSKVFDGILVAKDNPKTITGIDTSLCGLTVALNKGYVEVPLVEGVGPDCVAAGKPEPTVSLFDSSADCVQAILAGRADAYMNDVNTVTRFIAEHPADLSSAETVMLDYTIGIGVPTGKTAFRDAIQAALTAVQSTGLQAELATKWQLDANAVAEPTILTAD
ncbi:ABC transporter substrate-binding protein [Nakamurella flavida]|uniref:ABC transporter substrate-binding protein n=1 Tax=Nakamurella flavida TaxID=363630 RepID=A0A938YMC0_9ACTN|nr:ABC transporter substrate-binding protein [Nakamurella flavida]MBM9476007.1 ABC transporter substrate-binding protein [Nakamurella flavida]MDP9777250.1 polar amino acid transport system substrate-binding protein [Nakamurella flavida]